MTERNDSPSIRFGVIFIQLIFLFSITLAKEYESVYTQAELKAKYGQGKLQSKSVNQISHKNCFIN